MKQIRLITLAPGHFHAALVQKRMLPEVNRRSYVYGPLDADTIAHLNRIANYNSRLDDPANWDIDFRSGPNWPERFAREQPGNTVVLSGRNRPKIELMRMAVGNGLNVLADKPWLIDSADFPKLEELFQEAALREVLLWDVLTERHEITQKLLRELVCTPEIFGKWQEGTPEYPALTIDSLHFLKKKVSELPLVRPWWWFDPSISGEALADVGTHLADLSIWLIAPDQSVDYRNEISLLTADRWPLLLSEDQFCTLTALPAYAPDIDGRVVNGQLYYAGNNSVTFTLRGVHVKLTAMWEFESPTNDPDGQNTIALGTKARIAVRSSPEKQRDLFVAAFQATQHKELNRLLARKMEELTSRFPGLSVVDHGSEFQVAIPDHLRTTHESHFTAVLEEFARYFNTPRAVPPWEKANALARYYITTMGVELARQKRLSK
ncbi:MAG TPA: putative oxidoreductase C-terminal domain-containing protein [Gemmata sp.]|jgi:predicted dehydrogenase|nr:putative oxidoreductase C-terminal domain-containing protein [Gemmata sp.]